MSLFDRPRVLYLTRNADALRRQLAGEALALQTAGELRDEVSTDEMTPVWTMLFCDQRMGDYVYLGLQCEYETVKAYGSEFLKKQYLAKLVSGEWLAAMALTETQAGSDLGVLRTQTVAQPDGRVRVTTEWATRFTAMGSSTRWESTAA